jgi:hypothetical protein
MSQLPHDPGRIPNPDGPLPGPFPDPPLPEPPLPDPGPIPFPEQPWRPPERVPLPPDWWRCWRRVGVSGRYDGTQGSHHLFGSSLELRVDVDPRYSSDSPVMNRVSGDFWVTRLVREGRFWRISRTYVESWIVDTPSVSWQRCQVVVTGAVRFWQGTHPATTVTITIPWAFGAIGTGSAVFTTGGVPGAAYSLTYRSDNFRDLNLELDFCASVDDAPTVPSYHTHWHANRPADTSARTLTIESAYRETGIGVKVDPAHTVIDDSAPGFASWSPAELHDAMETSYSRFPGAWPAWNMWGLLAGQFDSSGVGGIMFDAAAGFGGAGEAPERQGFAVFRDHSWFTDLVDGSPANQDQAWAMRHYLYTYVHEAGHAFNLLHSWNKSRPSSLSWMNYDWKYDQINGTDAFWSGFRFRFDDEELIHLRHGDRAAVIMGGDPWASGGHLESPSASTIESEPGGDLELLLRAKPYFGFMEPVGVELRLRNLTPDPLPVDARLDPKYGTTSVFVQRPDGSRIEYGTVFCLYGTPETVELAPAATAEAEEGPDRHSALVPLTFGVGGFTFAEPGTYLVRAVYQAAAHLVTSNTLRLRVGHPTDRTEDRFAADFFTPQVGLNLALGGSTSPFLRSGLDTLTEAAAVHADRPLGAKAAATVARAVGSDFYRRDDRDALVQHHRGDPDEALAVTEPAVSAYHESGGRAENIEYAELVRLRTRMHVEAGRPEAAADEVGALADDLAARGANPNVVADVRSSAPVEGGRRTAKKAPAKKAAKRSARKK